MPEEVLAEKASSSASTPKPGATCLRRSSRLPYPLPESAAFLRFSVSKMSSTSLGIEPPVPMFM
ncbi:hypothetical protein SAMN04489710_101191 [Paracidovorax konjaci]|uniref:Uncharacterized protein n=1 Tax=Paracidovorax konjaci TaxID=32040 RepID=A0A1I1RQL2_9BURK|nr:hypothetical protein SAMN04489710_101191 [Paracidovorax konjaci]